MSTSTTKSRRFRYGGYAPPASGQIVSKVAGDAIFLTESLSYSLTGSPWVGVLDPLRGYDWSRAGVRGGIPTTFTKDGATITAGTSTATINARISAAANDAYLEFGAGTFNLTGLTVSRSRVILRGLDPTQTILNFTGTSGAFGLGACIAVPSDFLDMNSPAHQANWTAGYTRGATTITLSSTTGLAVGHLLCLCQENDIVVQANNITTGSEVPVLSYDGSGGGGGTWGGIVDREQIEVQEVAAINGSTVTISPGLRVPNWASGKNPKAGWTGTAPLFKIGIENMTIDLTSSGSTRGVGFMGAKDCWIKNVKTRFAGRCHVQFLQSMNCEALDGHLFEGVAHASQSYGVETFDASDCLTINNIAIRVTSPWMASGASIGCVRAYNYSDLHTFAGDWMQESLYYHAAGTLYVLDEGNHTNGIIFDQVHGPSSLCVSFRNRLTGFESGKAQQTTPYHCYALSRFNSCIGSVLGTSTHHTDYEFATPDAGSGYASIWHLGYGDNDSAGGGSFPLDDTLVKTSLMRWGNYDTVTATVRFQSGEVPSGITNYSNAVPANNNLPASFFLSSRPLFFGSSSPVTWPPIGPDVTGGDISNVGGHAYSIPAKRFYDAATKSGQGEITSYDGAGYYT